MGIITVGLDENNRASGKITLLQPPGGDSHMAELTNPDSPPVKLSQRIVQPPGGASTDLFRCAETSSESGSENGEETISRPRPYSKYCTYDEKSSVNRASLDETQNLALMYSSRMASSFSLGDEPPAETKHRLVVKKASQAMVNPVTGRLLVSPGDTHDMSPPPPPEPAKTNRIPPGGHSTRLW